MVKVMLFGSGGIPSITQDVANAILSLSSQAECMFMVGDGALLDQSYNEFLSRAGLRDNTIVYGISGIRNNKYKHNKNVIKGEYNTETHEVELKDESGAILHKICIDDPEKLERSPQWGTTLDMCMARQCDLAICVWDGKTKAEQRVMDYLSIANKACYIYLVEV